MSIEDGREINSIEDLYREFNQPVFRYLYRLSGSRQAAEDLTQETFYQAVLSVYRFRGAAKVTTWLFKIARNLYLNYQRSEVRAWRFQGVLEKDEPGHEGGDTPQVVLERQETSHRVQEILRNLPEDFRSVLILKEVEKMSHIEIAQVLGKTVASTKVLLHRAKKKFREEYQRLEGNI